MRRLMVFLLALVLVVAFGVTGCSHKPDPLRLVIEQVVEIGDWAMLAKYPFLKGKPNALEVKGLGLQMRRLSQDIQVYNYLGKGKWRLETLLKGTEVLSDANRRPWYKASCGNRLFVPVTNKNSWLPGTAKEPGLVSPENFWSLPGAWNLPWWLPLLLLLLLLPLLWLLGRRRGEREAERRRVSNRRITGGGGQPIPTGAGRPTGSGPTATGGGARIIPTPIVPTGGGRVTDVKPPVTASGAEAGQATPGAAAATAAVPQAGPTPGQDPGAQIRSKRISVSIDTDGTVHLFGQEWKKINFRQGPTGNINIDATPTK